ncbi:MAG TPA: ribosome biogenesis GTP-binding protein YihA/YsxC [Candidatus Kapabacteria bacterium]|nr:ribosome biogenesis GTP-binding protein YihA/YsxC [Candidatus Kapabacteria bacterium]
MKFTAKFVSSFATIASLPSDGSVEIALIGRSNVGKSSLINALVGQKQLAKTSSTPGKTQLLNYFRVDGEFYLVDMPGYGYARTAIAKREQWAKLTERYFRERTELVAVGLLVDARHPELESDRLVAEWFEGNRIPFFIVITKADKAKQQEIAKHKQLLAAHFPASLGVFVTSSSKGTGIATLQKFIVERARARNLEGTRVLS